MSRGNFNKIFYVILSFTAADVIIS